MNQILHNVLKKKTINHINQLGKGISELIIDVHLSFGIINTIEYIKSENKIIVHFFKYDFDLSFDYDDLEEYDKILIYQALKAI
jgi:hypothetical protein